MAELPGLQAAIGDRYTIERELGRGGTALVFLARDRKLHDRPVALKVLRPDLAAALGSERFLGEIATVAHLAHPHILTLHDSGEAGGFLYYVMPYVEGESLRDRLTRERQFSIEDALQVAREVADALSYAHSHDVVHRDIKPENILLQSGHAVVADFGIATAISEASDRSSTDSRIVVGTPAYMSPEQGSGDPYVDGRSDIYSLGCVLYEMLAGHPPFTGANAQTIIARHSVDPVPSLRTARPALPEGVERAISKALAKVPADRFATASRFSDALEKAGTGDVEPRRRWGRVAVVSLLVAVTVAAAWLGFHRATPLDPNKVVVFPLVERGSPNAAKEAGAGEQIALMIGSALERTEPLKWIDGWTWLGASERANVALLTATGARSITRARGARYYVDGSLIRGTDSTTVILRLNDAGGDSLIAQASTRAALHESSPAELGLRGVTSLLPQLLAPGRGIDLSAMPNARLTVSASGLQGERGYRQARSRSALGIDLSALTARRPAAIASWLQGEREYRQSRFRRALEFYKRAINEDSALAVAALKGAQAASWENLESDAVSLVRVALAHSQLLPSKHRNLAAGLSAYLSGEADSAVAQLSQALAEDPEWAEAHMAIGEVFYHLLPRTAAPLDSLADASFHKAAELDTGFAPPLYHLAEIAIRDGNLAEATRVLKRFEGFEPDSARRRQLGLMLSCVSGKPGATPWTQEGRVAPLDVLQAARALAVGGRQPRCAEEALRSVIETPELSAYHWGAFKGLHGLMVAQERYPELASLMDSVIKGGMRSALALYFLDVFAGAPFDSEASAAEAALRRQYGEQFTGVSVQARWLIASWYARRRDSAGVARIRTALLSDPAASALPVSQALAGHVALGKGDTAAAIRHFATLKMVAPRGALEWGLVEPLAVERFAMAEIALARGQFPDAGRIAAVFDHPTPVAFLPFIARSLHIRLLAARALHRPEEVNQYGKRLQNLKHGSSLASTN